MTTSYWRILASLVPLVVGMALSMSPMTAAIMSAVPARRAGAGSAMNDATRELGAALGIAVMGSVAASQYTRRLDDLTSGLPATVRSQASSSLADALDAASRLPTAAGRVLATGAQQAFIDGIHLAVTVGSLLALVAAVTVYRYLPKQLAGDAALHGPLESMEEMAELGVAGVPPVFADAVDDEHIDAAIAAERAAEDEGAVAD
jgi:hypothetical protein